MEEISLLQLKKEAYDIFKMGWLGKSTMASILGASLAITLFVRCNFMRYIMFHAPKRRPINILIMIDQLTLLVPYMVVSVMVIISVVLGSSLLELAGSEKICSVYWFSACFLVAFGVYGSSGIAVYRLLIIKGKSSWLEPFQLMWLVLVLQNLVMMAIIISFYYGLQYSNTGSVLSFCFDRTFTYSRILATYSYGYAEPEFTFGVRVQTMVMGFTILVGMTELTIYGGLFYQMYKHDKHNMMGLVSPEVIKKRNQNNVMTIGGQTLAFVGNMAVLVFFIAVLNLSFIHDSVDEAANGVLIMIVTEAANCMVHLYSSPEMRKFLFEKTDKN